MSTFFQWEGERPKSAGESPIDFIAYLRTALLEGAGFPGLLGLKGFGKVRDRLLKDVPVF